MIEMPEAVIIAKQMASVLPGKEISSFQRGPLTHKFLWLNYPDDHFIRVLPSKFVTGAASYGRSIYLYLGDQMLWWGDTGGRLLYRSPGNQIPSKYHLRWDFTDGSSLTFQMRMWGFVRLIDITNDQKRPLNETGIPPLDPNFTFQKFNSMLDQYPEKGSKGIKGFLVATSHVMDEHINGLGNAIIQDILFRARIHPKRKIDNLPQKDRLTLYHSIQEIIFEAIQLRGRYDERDLFNCPGDYIRIMDSKKVGTTCPNCGELIQRINYLGGACYICSKCQT